LVLGRETASVTACRGRGCGGFGNFGFVSGAAAAVAKAVLFGPGFTLGPRYELDYLGQTIFDLMRCTIEDGERRGIGFGWRIPL